MSDELLTRNDVRRLGLNVTNTTFQRWESAEYGGLLTAIKPSRRRSSKVFYRRSEVEKLLATKKTDTTDTD